MKKLRRGLHDLSPLFHSAGPPVFERPFLPTTPLDVQFLSVFVPEHEGDAFLVKDFYEFSEVGKRPRQSVDLVDNYDIDAAGIDIAQ